MEPDAPVVQRPAEAPAPTVPVAHAPRVEPPVVVYRPTTPHNWPSTAPMTAQTAIEGNTVRKIEPVPDFRQTPLAEVVQFPKPKLVEPAPAKPAPTPMKSKKEAKAKTAVKSDKSKTPQSRPMKVVAKSQAVLALETILPILPSGWWWEVSANAKGYKIDLRWRENGKKTGHTFSRLGKNKYESILEKDHAKQFWIIYDRLVGELESDERDSHRQAATRIRPRTLND